MLCRPSRADRKRWKITDLRANELTTAILAVGGALQDAANRANEPIGPRTCQETARTNPTRVPVHLGGRSNGLNDFGRRPASIAQTNPRCEFGSGSAEIAKTNPLAVWIKIADFAAAAGPVDEGVD